MLKRAAIIAVALLLLTGRNQPSAYTVELAYRLEPLLTISAQATSLGWSPDGRMLVTHFSNGVESDPIVFWDATTGARLDEIAAGVSVTEVAWSPDGHTLAVASSRVDNNATVELFDVESGQVITTFSGFGSGFGISEIQWSPGSNTIAVTLGEGWVRLLDATTGKDLYQEEDMPLPRNFQHGISWSPDGRLFASMDADSALGADALAIWDAATGKLARSLPPETSDYRGSFAWSPDGRNLAIQIFDIYLWDPFTGRHKLTIDTNASDITWSHDGRLLASVDGLSHWGPGDPDPRVGGIVRLWDPDTGSEVRALLGDDEFKALDIEWSPARHTLAIVTWESVTLWGVPDRSQWVYIE